MLRAAGLFLGLSLAGAVGSTAFVAGGLALRIGDAAPEISGERWINSQPLTIRDLRGKVVLVEFWTYG